MFLDFTYITACNFYRKREKNIFKISGLILLAGTILMNFVLVYMIFYNYYKNQINEHVFETIKWSLIGIYFILLLPLLGLRYFKITSYDKVNNKIYSLSSSKRNAYQMCATLYIILSFGVTISYAIYNGGIINGWW